MTDATDFELPHSSYALQIIERPLSTGGTELLRIRVRPLHPINAEPQEFLVTMTQFREAEEFHVENKRALDRALSGDPGEYEVKLAHQWIENSLNDQEVQRLYKK